MGVENSAELGPKEPTKLTPEAIALLRQVQKAITEEPLRLNMAVWAKQDSEPGDMSVPNELCPANEEKQTIQLPKCGTVGCIAGWVTILGTPKAEFNTVKINGVEMIDIDRLYDFEVRAQQLLGITEQQGYALFYLPTWNVVKENYLPAWPKEFADRYQLAATREEKAKIACERIDYFIEHLK